MTDQPLQPRRITRALFPSEPERRLTALLSALNGEPKSMLIATCLDEQSFKTATDLGRAYRAWADWPNARTLPQYAHHTLVPIGLVAEEEVTVFSSPLSVQVGWRLSPEGARYGRPAAAYALRTAVEQNLSLYRVFGNTASVSKKGNRAPGSTAKILKMLDSGVDQMCDLAEQGAIGMNNIREHLLRLKGAGLVVVDSVSSESTGWARYAWNEGKDPEKAPPYIVGNRAYKRRSRLVAQELWKRGSADANEITKAIGYKDSTNIMSVLTRLVDFGYATPTFVGGKKQSEAALTEKGKVFARFVHTLDEMLADGPALQRLTAEATVLSPDITQGAIDLYAAVSSRANAKPAEDWMRIIIAFTKDYTAKNGYGPRPAEIEKAFNRRGIHTYLQPLIVSGILKKETRGKQVRYRLSQG